MFTLFFDRASEVVLARFTGVFTTEDFVNYDAALIHFLSNEGQPFADRVRGLCDYSAVEAIAEPQSRIAEQASRPPFIKRLRVVVAPPNRGRQRARGRADTGRSLGIARPRQPAFRASRAIVTRRDLTSGVSRHEMRVCDGFSFWRWQPAG